MQRKRSRKGAATRRAGAASWKRGHATKQPRPQHTAYSYKKLMTVAVNAANEIRIRPKAKKKEKESKPKKVARSRSKVEAKPSFHVAAATLEDKQGHAGGSSWRSSRGGRMRNILVGGTGKGASFWSCHVPSLACGRLHATLAFIQFTW